ncbi:MAG: DUF433 domain-containing protein [Saprospiraceae bacterium]|nr:DUF433 domain-containing protein [Saprospiraceae bacterium]
MVDYKQHIHSDSKVMLGKPIIKGTRITVELLLRKLADGYSFEEILGMYPHLKLDDILAAVAYAAAMMESEEVIIAA